MTDYIVDIQNQHEIIPEHAQKMAEELIDLSGQNINGYHLLRELGLGNTGMVYLARQESMEREVAFKRLLPEFSNDPEYIANFMRESRIAARLDHRNIVQALDVGYAPEGWLYFVMEYVPGHSLEEIRMEQPELISLEFLLRVSIQLADAMQYAWTNFQMTHGDIKPANLLIRDSDHTLKLADLGLANIGGTGSSGSIMATPMYAAPEVITGANSTPSVKSDLYSFGVMFYELAGGTAPFHGDIDTMLRSHVEKVPTPLIEMNPDLDREVSDFVDRLLAKNPDERPADWIEVKEFARRYLDKLRVRSNASGPALDLNHLKPERDNPEPMSESARQVFAAIVTLAAAVAVGLLAVLAWLSLR